MVPMLSLGGLPLVLIVSASLVAPATPTAAGSDIPPVVWELVEFTGSDGVPGVIADPSRYTVQFLPDGHLTAKIDCNQGSAGYTVSAGNLTLTVMAVTVKLCLPGSHAGIFQRMLQASTSYRFAPDGFLLLRGDAGVLRLRPALTGVLWQWQAVTANDGEIRLRPERPEHYTVTFLPDGALAIQADCNRASGAYTVTGASIDLQIGGVTRKMCLPGSLMDPFLRDLDQVISHVFHRGALSLALAGGAGVMEFASTVAPPTDAPPAAN